MKLLFVAVGMDLPLAPYDQVDYINETYCVYITYALS